MRRGVILSAAVGLLCVNLVPGQRARAEDWPAYLHDARRSGACAEALTVPLTQIWVRTTTRPPTPAWVESPAVHDYLHNHYDLKPRQHFDRCFHPVVVGDHLYFGSSNSGAVTCVDVNNGADVWTFFAEGPVRFAPHVDNGRVYFGSDDGWAYCVSASTGSLVWKDRAGPSDEMIWGNENMISVWPVRSSVLVDGDDVFWTAGIFPEEGTFICKRNAADGKGGWTKPAKRPPQGYLSLTRKFLIVPTGKTFPTVYHRADGKHVGDIAAGGRGGGCWVLITPDSREAWSGPSVSNESQRFDLSSRARIATVPGANCLLADSNYAYFNTDTRIAKIDRKKMSCLWSKEHAYPFALIRAGRILFAGGEDEAAAFDAEGNLIWKAAVDGRAYGLAVAGGRLFVSTDTGAIHCYRAMVPAVANRGATCAQTGRAAQLGGELLSCGAATPEVRVYWGRADGGTEAAKWESSRSLGAGDVGMIRCNLTELKENSVYYYRFRATNAHGDAWSASSSVIITGRISVRAIDSEASEGGGNSAAFEVSRPEWAKAVPLEVAYAVGGSATEGADYKPLRRTVLIPAGHNSATIAVEPEEDRIIAEPRETVKLTLAPGPYLPGDPRTATVTILADESLAAWKHRMRISFPGYDRAETLNDFPVLLVLDGAAMRLGQSAAPDGSDLRFTDASGSTFLRYEIARWDPAGKSYVWVQVSKLSAGSHIRAYWGNPAARRPPVYSRDGSAWSEGYVGVWHLDEKDGDCVDSSTSGNHAKPEHGVRQGVDGMLLRAAWFDGQDDQIRLRSILGIGATSNTTTAWVRVPRVGAGGLAPGERVGIILGNFSSPPPSNWEIHASGETRFFWNGGKIDEHGATDLRDGKWHFLAWVRDKERNKCFMYVDGKIERTIGRAGADITFSATHGIGGDNRPNPPNFHGEIDELRVSGVARSSDWIWACWKSQQLNAGFVSYGDVE